MRVHAARVSTSVPMCLEPCAWDGWMDGRMALLLLIYLSVRPSCSAAHRTRVEHHPPTLPLTHAPTLTSDSHTHSHSHTVSLRDDLRTPSRERAHVFVCCFFVCVGAASCPPGCLTCVCCCRLMMLLSLLCTETAERKAAEKARKAAAEATGGATDTGGLCVASIIPPETDTLVSSPPPVRHAPTRTHTNTQRSAK